MRTIRKLESKGVQTLLDWAAREGWNPGLADVEPFFAADPNGFLGAFVGEEIVAGIAAVAYGENYGFIGLYICHPDWRGQGHGKAIWDAGLAYLGERTIGLDGVPEQQANYASMGFVKAYETIRMSGVVEQKNHTGVGPVASVSTIHALDTECFPAKRTGFLRHWVAEPRKALALVEDGPITGYAVARQCIDGQKIGPIFARSELGAMTLLKGFSGAIQIDVPAYQHGFLRQLEGLGFTPGFTTARMYRGEAPQIDQSKVFGITSLELG